MTNIKLKITTGISAVIRRWQLGGSALCCAPEWKTATVVREKGQVCTRVRWSGNSQAQKHSARLRRHVAMLSRDMIGVETGRLVAASVGAIGGLSCRSSAEAETRCGGALRPRLYLVWFS